MIETEPEHAARPRAMTSLLVLAVCASVLFAGFVALGSWQIKRLFWKRDLIARVDQRVHAAPSSIPPPERWSAVSDQADAYRHVRVDGVFLNEFTTWIDASTVLGRGYWKLTPLRTADGHVIWINRGFVAAVANQQSAASEAVEMSGLLRISEPGGRFLRPNLPEQQRWYSRDVAALSATYHLARVAPFFIDADATAVPPECRAGGCSDHPVGGLTVIAFNDNHLVYSLTWFALALMLAIACYILGRTELRLRRQVRDPSINRPPS